MIHEFHVVYRLREQSQADFAGQDALSAQSLSPPVVVASKLDPIVVEADDPEEAERRVTADCGAIVVSVKEREDQVHPAQFCFNTDEAAVFCRCSRRTIDQAVKTGEIRCGKSGGNVYTRPMLLRWMAKKGGVDVEDLI